MEIDINNLSKNELTSLAKELAKANTAIHNAMCYAEDISNNEILKEIETLDENSRILFLEKLAKIFIRVSNDDSMADPQTTSAYFQSFQDFGSEFQEYIDKTMGL